MGLKMKGLILKDLYNMKNQWKMVAIIIVFYAFWGFTNGGAEISSFLLIFLSIMLSMSSFSYDEAAKWDSFALCMPVSRKFMVLSKYALGMILTIMATILSLILSIFVFKMDFQSTISMCAVAGGLSLVMLSLLFPMILKFGVEKGRIGIFILFIIPSITVLMLSNVGIEVDLDALMNLNVAIYALALAVIFILSILISMAIYKRKEF